MVMPAVVSRLFWTDLPPAKELYVKMNSDIALRNLSTISDFSGIPLKSSLRKYGEIRIPKERGWYRRFRSTPRLDTAAVDRTYEIILKIRAQKEKQDLFRKMKANFDASLKGLERLIVFYNSNDVLKAQELKEIQARVLTTIAEQDTPEEQVHLEDEIEVTVEDHVPPPPLQPDMERIMPKKIVLKRRPHSVCFVQVDLEGELMKELFAKIKIKSPVKEEETTAKEGTTEDNEWDQPTPPYIPETPDPMSASMMRSGLQRTVSYYDKRTPLYMPQQKPLDMSLVFSAVAARRLSMRGKGFED